MQLRNYKTLGLVIVINSGKVDKVAQAYGKIKRILIALSTILFIINVYIANIPK